MTTVLNEIKTVPTEKPTTLDSLQGVWLSDEDDKYEVKIFQNKWIEIYEKQEGEPITFVITESCKSEQLTTNGFGKFIVKLSELKPNFCYEIDLLSAEELSIVYADTKVQNFKRKK